MNITNFILTVFVSGLIGFFILGCLITFTNRKEHKYYKKGYFDMITCPVSRRIGYPHFIWMFEHSTLVWLEESNDFIINKDTQLHNAFYTYLDPFSCYWYIKYTRAARRLRFQDHDHVNV